MGKRKLDIDDFKVILREHADRCAQLADKLTETGDKLKPEDRGLLRVAMYPMIDESITMLKSAYLMGRLDWMDVEVERIREFADITTF